MVDKNEKKIMFKIIQIGFFTIFLVACRERGSHNIIAPVTAQEINNANLNSLRHHADNIVIDTYRHNQDEYFFWTEDSATLTVSSSKQYITSKIDANVAGKTRFMYVSGIYAIGNPSWESYKKLAFTLAPGNSNAGQIYVGMGDFSYEDSIGYSKRLDNHVGFEFIGNNQIYATVANGTDETKLLIWSSPLNGSAKNTFKAEFHPSKSEARFYFNGDLIGTITTTLPSGHISANRHMNFRHRVDNPHADADLVWFGGWRYYEEQ